MINKLLMKLRPVEGGYDPIPSEYAQSYANGEWDQFNPVLVDILEERLGGFAGKRILDIGAGPGQHAVTFARRGAQVTWHDISRNYMEFAKAKAASFNVEMEFSLGYMEEAARFQDRPFDLVFNRICWSYCLNDANFARVVHGLIRPGGHGYIDNFVSPDQAFFRPRYWLNAATGIKVGHPYPPPGRLERLFLAFGDLDLEVMHRSATNERLFLTRQGRP